MSQSCPYQSMTTLALDSSEWFLLFHYMADYKNMRRDCLLNLDEIDEKKIELVTPYLTFAKSTVRENVLNQYRDKPSSPLDSLSGGQLSCFELGGVIVWPTKKAHEGNRTPLDEETRHFQFLWCVWYHCWDRLMFHCLYRIRK